MKYALRISWTIIMNILSSLLDLNHVTNLWAYNGYTSLHIQNLDKVDGIQLENCKIIVSLSWAKLNSPFMHFTKFGI